MDEQVLRQYSNIGQRLEDKGIKPEYVGLGATAFMGYSLTAAAIFEAFACLDKIRNGNNVASGAIIQNLKTKIFTSWGRTVRFPTFGLAVGLFATGMYNLISGLINKDNSSLAEAAPWLFYSLGTIGIPSSMYLRDRDPKLLDKQSIWKTVIGWAKNKVAPQPLPEPVASRTIDDYVVL